MITITPRLYLGNATVSCDIEDLDTRPVAMHGFQIEWGRDTYFGDADPSRLTLTLWDATDLWATRIRDGNALGHPGRVEFDVPSGTVTMFRGQITAAAASQHPSRTLDNGRHVWVVTLTLSDPVQALGSIFPLPGVLNATENMASRRAWLAGLALYGGQALSGINYDNTTYGPAKCSPLPVGDDSALELTRQFYASMGDSFTYDADANRLQQTLRMSQAFTTTLASFDDVRGSVMITAGDFTAPSRPASPGVALSACSLVVPDGITIEASIDTDINSMEMTREIRGSQDNIYEYGDQGRGTYYDTQNNTMPRRLFRFETWMWEVAYADNTVMDRVWAKARNEGRRPKHPPLTYRPGHQFATERMARWWLRTWEDARPAFINGDSAHHWLMAGATSWPPLVSPLGATVTWDGVTGWAIDMNVQWMQDTTTVTPMTYANLQQLKWTSTATQVPWWWALLGLPVPPPVQTGAPTPERDVRFGPPGAGGETDRFYRFDESVMYDDLKHLDNTTREIKDILT